MAKAVNRRSIVEKLNKHGYEVVRTNQLFELFSNEEGKAVPLAKNAPVHQGTLKRIAAVTGIDLLSE